MLDRAPGLPRTRTLRSSWVNKGERKAGPPEEVPDILWKVTLPKPTPLCCDEPRDDTGNHDENRALAH
jgi:hypothetical protein